MLLQIINICSVYIDVLYLTIETSQFDTYKHKPCNETKQRGQCDLWPDHKKTTNIQKIGPIKVTDSHAPILFMQYTRLIEITEQIKIRFKNWKRNLKIHLILYRPVFTIYHVVVRSMHYIWTRLIIQYSKNPYQSCADGHMRLIIPFLVAPLNSDRFLK